MRFALTARPRLFLAVDGPRADQPDDKNRCAAVRETLNTVDWPCDVQYLVRDRNLGCRRAMAGAIDWFFGHVEDGIILEDDCVPSPGFFRFCDQLLSRYRTDERVWIVSGFNALGTWRPSQSSYFFGHTECWGWATWRRAWHQADIDLAGLSSPGLVAQARRTLGRRRWAYLEPQLKAVAAGELDSWAYAWAFACAAHGGLTALPCENLVKNIGFGPDATHSTDPASAWARMEVGRVDEPLRHPAEIEIDRAYERLALSQIYRSPLERTVFRVGHALPEPVRGIVRYLYRRVRRLAARFA